MAEKKTTKKTVAPRDDEETVTSGELKPFIDWDEQPEIEGKVGNLREIDGEFGAQEVIDVGDFTVGLTTALMPLKKLNGSTVRVVYLGYQESKKSGREFKNFAIFLKKTA